ncbi:T9SS type A sorting domain-containing protein [Parasediminibacterium sp. JCM 36343]|uniref:NHL domain-containing protein n=1 Tax=Parasediminibacterium sp. JCM 36343 TaxID=3374279 RepID=UPI0039793429
MKQFNKRANLVFAFIIVCIAYKSNGQTITTIAGNGSTGFNGDSILATSASLSNPTGLCVDALGNVYVADRTNNRIRKISTSGVITTVAGNGKAAFSGDNGPAIAASLGSPYGVCIDSFGNLYIADTENNRVRKVSVAGIITTVAGTSYGFSGDSSLAISAQLSKPSSVCVDNAGNLFIADQWNSRIRKVNTSGIITTVAGNGMYNYSGDNGPATAASLHEASGVTVDAAGNIYIVDFWNSVIRKVNTAGIITTVAGNGNKVFSGDNGLATSASLSWPWGASIDTAGNLYIADARNNRIRKVNPAGIITTIAGNGIQGFSGDNGSPANAGLNAPDGICQDAFGNFYIADANNNRIRKITYSPTLGVKLETFAISLNKQMNALLQWQTTNETNTQQFIIERSNNAQSFSSIGTIAAKGSGNNSYTFTDITPLQGMGAYRLKIQDKDGSFAYSKIVVLDLSSIRQQFSISPNPIQGKKATISFNIPTMVKAIGVYGMNGKQILNKGINAIVSEYILTLNGMASGTYLIKIMAANGTTQQQQVIVK